MRLISHVPVPLAGVTRENEERTAVDFGVANPNPDPKKFQICSDSIFVALAITRGQSRHDYCIETIRSCRYLNEVAWLNSDRAQGLEN